jgi:biotin-(acetyl-CoA carboxylase) ligase
MAVCRTPRTKLSLVRWSTKKARGEPEAVAVGLASRGEGEGTVIAAHRAGDPALRFSVLLRPISVPHPELLRLIIPFSTSEGIRKDTGIITWLKWPGRVLAGRKTIATTSTVVGPGSYPQWVVLSASILTGPVVAHDPDKISLLDLLGVEVEPDLLLEKVLESLSWMYHGWTRGMNDHIMSRYGSMLDTIGRQVQISDHGSRAEGIVKGIDAMGNLEVELKAGLVSIMVEDADRVKEL